MVARFASGLDFAVIVLVAMPIKPSEVVAVKGAGIPPAVFAAFDELIARHWNGVSSQVLLSEAVDLAILKMSEAGTPVTREEIFAKRWMDVEYTYRAAGWWVDFDKPGYCETYPASYKFRKRR